MVYIKSIEMTGFKSYGKGTLTLNFPDGFTGIIGPNGSGKSNIVDAISFTLGELSSKSMRASELSDLIYAKPGDKADKAIVNITFDNSDHKIPVPFDEVSVQREVKRSRTGAVYRFNGQRSTRQEIMDKLKIANIDVKEGFNLVLQGRIAELVGMNPEKRREMIEDLAGTIEFDEKKIQAIEELEKAEIKLGEFDLLLKEVNGNLNKLKKEKESLEKWESTVEEIYESKSILYSYYHQKYLQEMKELQEKIEDITNDIKNSDAEKGDKLQKIQNIKSGIEDINKEIERKQAELEKIRSDLTNKNSEITGIKKDISHNENRNIQIKNEIEQLEKKNKDLKSNQEKLSDNILKISTKLEELNQKKLSKEEEYSKINNLLKRSEVEYKSIEKKIQELDIQVNEVDEKINKLNIQNSMKSSTLGIKEEQYSTGIRELGNRKRILQRIDEDIIIIKNEIDQTRELLEISQNKIKNSISKQESYENILDDLTEKNKDLERGISSIKAKIDTIENFIGETSPVLDAIMKKAKNKEILGIIGRLGDLIPVDDIGLSIEEKATLIPFLNSIIVESAYTAQECIAYLRNEQLGYGSFIPLEELKNLKIKSNQETSYNFESKLEGKLEPILNIFKDIIVLPTLKEAIDKFILDIEKGGHNNQILTIDGDKISREGIIFGGVSSETNEILISELNKKLEIQKEKLDDNLKHIQVNKMKHKKLIQIVTDITKKSEIIRQTMKNKENNLSDLEKRRAEISDFVERTENKVNSLKLEIESTKTLINTFEEDLSEREKKKEELNNSKEELVQEMDKIRYDQLLEKIREVENLLSEINVKYSKLEGEKNNYSSQIDLYSNQIKENEQQIQNLIIQNQQLEKENIKLNSDLIKYQEQLKQKIETENDLKNKLTALNDSIKDENQSISNIRKQISTIDLKLDRYKQKVSEIKINRERISTELENVKLKIKEEEIDIRDIKDDINEKSLENQIFNLTEEKKSLEPINALAIKQYNEANERFLNLKEKREQINEERKIIVDFINKIEFEKKTIFMRIFNKINKEFGILFDMIAGGKAWLKLENPDDPFEGGITIDAEPHGKKVKSLQAMSGGEKSLTALAL
ncbi:MAG: chromosome segregation protein SMC, partial [Promethearchaeota archaeon]